MIHAGLRSVTAPQEEDRKKESDRQPDLTLCPYEHMHAHAITRVTHHRCTFLPQNPDIRFDELSGRVFPSTCPTPPPKLKRPSGHFLYDVIALTCEMFVLACWTLRGARVVAEMVRACRSVKKCVCAK